MHWYLRSRNLRADRPSSIDGTFCRYLYFSKFRDAFHLHRKRAPARLPIYFYRSSDLDAPAPCAQRRRFSFSCSREETRPPSSTFNTDKEHQEWGTLLLVYRTKYRYAVPCSPKRTKRPLLSGNCRHGNNCNYFTSATAPATPLPSAKQHQGTPISSREVDGRTSTDRKGITTRECEQRDRPADKLPDNIRRTPAILTHQ